MHRDPNSHKGDNGKVAVIGGSRFIHGAPIFNALAAEAGGVDTLSVCLPKQHADAARVHCLNAFVMPFAGEELTDADVESLGELLATIDCAVLGSGIGRERIQVDALLNLISAASCPVVLDATALQPETLSRLQGKTAVLTPHLAELERMDEDRESLAETAREAEVTFILKGSQDTVAGPDGSTETITGGNAGLTTGGTGDALAGLTAALIAQRTDPFAAACTACRIIKRAGTVLYPEKGYAYTAEDVIERIPGLMVEYSSNGVIE